MPEVSKPSSEGTPELCLPPEYRNRKRLRRAEASAYLKAVHDVQIATATLAKLACNGGGPEFSVLTRTPYYDLIELDRWVAEKLGRPRSSTSDRGA